MAEKEQVIRPLAPRSFQLRSDEDEAISMELKLKQRKYIKCCGCVTAIFLILVVAILILAFTVFHVKTPVITMNNIVMQGLEFANGTLRNDMNITLIADISVKNPNAASFKFKNGTTTIFYGGLMVGDATTPSGEAGARQTIHMKITVNLISSKFFAVPSLNSDLSSRVVTVSSYTVVGGKISIPKIETRHVLARASCTMMYNVSRQAVQEQSCRQDITI